MASPRSKATKVQYTSSEYQLIVQFVKSNIRFFLNLVSNETLSLDALTLSASEINALRVLFRVVRPDGSPFKSTGSLSSYAPFFISASATSTAKAKLSIVADWVLSALGTKDKQEDTIEFSGICKGVTIQDQDLQGKQIKITGCEDSYIYINSCVHSALVSGCVNCTIMVFCVALTW